MTATSDPFRWQVLVNGQKYGKPLPSEAMALELKARLERWGFEVAIKDLDKQPDVT